MEKFGCGRREKTLAKGESENQGEFFFKTRDLLTMFKWFMDPRKERCENIRELEIRVREIGNG